jgi:segregation and condensation protein B
MTPAKVKEKVIEYALKYNMPELPRGVILLTYGDSCQLCTKKYYLTEIREALGIKKSGTLSTSSLEALAIVAYNQPVTRVFVDTLRRADSSYAMNNLLDRGLIEVKGRLDVPGRPMLYGTTPDFLRAFGLKDISALPTTTEEIQAMFSKAKTVEDTAEDGEDSSQIAIELPEDESSQLSMDISVAEGEAEADKSVLSPESTENITDAYDEPSAEDDVILDEL